MEVTACDQSNHLELFSAASTLQQFYPAIASYHSQTGHGKHIFPS